jgi:uncharacterized protein YodC (DUF2158 family)
MASDNTPEFEVGDEVQHKTGGPKMIFVGRDQIGQAICTWMAGDRKQTETFSEKELKRYVVQSLSSGTLSRG